MNWGWKIAIFMGIYMIGIISVVWYAMLLDVNLVTEDYYQQELEVSKKITLAEELLAAASSNGLPFR